MDAKMPAAETDMPETPDADTVMPERPATSSRREDAGAGRGRGDTGFLLLPLLCRRRSIPAATGPIRLSWRKGIQANVACVGVLLPGLVSSKRAQSS